MVIFKRASFRLVVILILFLLTFVVALPEISAFHRLTVQVDVTRITNRLVKCFDPLVVGCSRPDYYAVITIRGNSEQAALSRSFKDSFILNRDTATPTNMTLTYTIENPIVEVKIFDFDGSGLAAIDGDDPADIVAGPGDTLVVPVTPAILNSTPPTAVIINTGDDTNVVVIIRVTREPALLNPVSVSKNEFDPSLGETITISGSVSDESRVRMWTTGPLGGGDIADFTATGAFSFPWNGKYIGGTPISVGTWRINVSAEGGTPVTNSVPSMLTIQGIQVIQRPPNTLALVDSFPIRNTAANPRPKWNPRAGPLRLDFSISTPASVDLDVGAGNTCPVTQSLRTLTASGLTAGTSMLSWDGMIDTPTGLEFAQPGNFVVELTAAFTTGQANTLPNPCVKVEIIPPPPLTLAVEHDPAFALVGESVTITATAVEDAQADRLTGTIQIWVADVLEVGAHRPPTRPIKECHQSATCSMSVLTLTPTTGQFAYKAVAFDIAGSFVETPWRMVSVVQQIALGTNTIVMAGVPMDFGTNPPSEFFGRFDRRKTEDIVFFPGNFPMSPDGGSANLFRGAVADHIRQIWGLGPEARFPSTFLNNQDNVSFWISLVEVSVSPSNPTASDPAENLCSYGAPSPSWANASAVVHRTPCRDNANMFYHIYSASSPTIGWHELHHAIVGLADEYCGSGPDCDGGYWQAAPFPNVYASHTDCVSDPLGALGFACLPIRFGNSGPIRGWRLDPDTDIILDNTEDVMILNTFELGADARRANFVFAECDQGKC